MFQMTTRTTILFFAACGCLAACGQRTFADDPKAGPAAAAAAPATKDVSDPADAGKLKSLNEYIEQGPKAADKLTVIEELLKDKSPKVRAAAVDALGAIGPAATDAVNALAEVFKDSDASVRGRVFRALHSIHPGPKRMIPICTKMLEDADPTLRVRILSAIADGGAEAVPGLILALKNEKACFWALIILRDHNVAPVAKDAVPAIVETLKDKRVQIRREAVLTLGALGDAAKPAVPELAKLLNDENSRIAATFVMGQLGEIPKDAEAAVRANAKSDDGMLSSTSLWALARVHPEDKEIRRETTQKLVERLKDKDAFVRAMAARALVALPPAPDITIPIFEKELKGADENTMHMAMEALAAMGEAAVPRLIDALKNEKFRPEIIYTLGRIGPKAAPATEELAKLIEDKNSRVAHEAIIALGNIGPGAKAAVPALVKALGQAQDKDMNFSAIEYALGKIGADAKSAEQVLEGELTSKDENVRQMGAWALSQIDPTSAEVATKDVPVLIAGLSDEDAEERLLAAEALGEFGPLAKDAVAALQKATHDSDKNVAEAAAKALTSVQKNAAGPTPSAPETPVAVVYKPGDQVITVDDKVEIGVAGKTGEFVAKGTKLKVLEIRGSWIGVRAEINGKQQNGWVLGEQITKQ
jgi:HEAT repeat protein